MVVPERPAAAPDLLVEADVRAAARALLRTPLLHVDAHAEELGIVRRHRDELTRLFADGLGYRLVVEPGLARLFKSGIGRDAGRGLRRRNNVAFTPRRYTMLALTLAALTRARRQLMVDELVAAVRTAAADAGIDVDLDAIADRRALHSALVALIDLGVLTERDGDLEHWAERRTDSLIDVHRDRLAVLVAAPIGGCDDASDVLAVTAVPSAAGGARVAIRRRLVEQPVLSVDELTDEQREWWRRNRHSEREWFHRHLGLDLELRAEGAVAIDPSGELTDVDFPASGSTKHFALLLLSELVAEIRATHGSEPGATWTPVATSTTRRAADRVFESWRRGLRKAHRERPEVLYEEAVGLLADMKLVRRHPAGLDVHAAAARFAPRPTLLAASSSEPSLFEEDD
ncbi:TIGR02678 family protein [Microlunatus ginsengisoli]|uniref:TIGR02678 family protein n=1 Tax=Microlunatus ginsengisoli TaxID=363863 RepID=A0ABP7A2L3_9ACTN